MRLTTDREGNTSFGDEMIRRADGKRTHCRECGAAFGALESKVSAELCGACVEKAPRKPARGKRSGKWNDRCAS